MLLAHNNPSLPNQLNDFYICFDKQNTTPVQRLLPIPTSNSDYPTIQEAEAKNLFIEQNTRKAAGPDNVSPSTLGSCGNQLAPILTDILTKSLQLCKVPLCFKTSANVLITKKAILTRLNANQLY